MSRFSSSFLAYFLVLCAVSIDSVYADTKGERDFKEAGYPTMFIIGGVVLVLVAIAVGGGGLSVSGIQSGCTQLFQHPLLFVLNTLILIFGIFLLFGHGGGQRVNILGFQLIVFVALAYYAGLSSSKGARYLLLGFGTFTWMGLIGALTFFNYNVPIWEITQPACLTYFDRSPVFDTDYSRCKDDGYIQLVRTTGSACILLLLFVLAVVFFDDSPSVAPSKKHDSERTHFPAAAHNNNQNGDGYTGEQKA